MDVTENLNQITGFLGTTSKLYSARSHIFNKEIIDIMNIKM